MTFLWEDLSSFLKQVSLSLIISSLDVTLFLWNLLLRFKDWFWDSSRWRTDLDNTVDGATIRNLIHEIFRCSQRFIRRRFCPTVSERENSALMSIVLRKIVNTLVDIPRISAISHSFPYRLWRIIFRISLMFSSVIASMGVFDVNVVHMASSKNSKL